MSAPQPHTREFHCPRWPGCQCPEGTIAADCPGRTVTVPSGAGGPAGAGVASPAAPVEAPAGAVVDRAGLKARGEAILSEMRAILERSDQALTAIRREFEVRTTLMEQAMNAHVEMGYVSRDLARLIKDL